jgi:glycosyltransferase involved in cell wall biosynthesis
VRIAVVTSLYPLPGRPYEGLFAERRWAGMAARGHEIRIVHPLPLAPPFARGAWGELGSSPRREVRAGVRIRRPRYLHLAGRTPLANARRFARAAWRVLAAEPDPDVVVLDYAWPAAALAPRLASERLPCLVHGRGSDVFEAGADARLAPALARGLAAAGHWAAVSEHLVAALDRLAGRRGGRFAPNGVDLELFRPRARAAARLALGRPPAGALVLVVGHWIPRKDPLLGLEAFAHAARPGDRLVFLGRGPLGPALAARAQELGLAGRVELVGEVAPEALALWYAAADVLLLTSLREGRPNVVLEALASGRPVLATAAGGTPELLAPLGQRALVPGRDAYELGRALSGLLAAPPAAEDLRALAEPWSWPACLALLERILEDVARGGDGARRGA